MSWPTRSFSGFLDRNNKSNLFWAWGLLVLGLGFSIVIAYMVVDDRSAIALGLILAIPAFLLLHRYPLLGLIIWLFVVPFVVVSTGGTTRKVYWVIHRALPLATLGIMLLGHYLRVQRRQLPKLSWAEYAMAGYIAVSTLSIIYFSGTVSATLYVLYDRVVVPMCLYLIVRFSAPNEKDLSRLLPVILFVLISQSIIGILSWVAPQTLPSVWLSRVGLRTTGSLRNYGVFSTTVMFAGLFILHRAMYHKPNLVRAGYIFSFLLAIVMVFLSFSRGSWLAGVFVAFGLLYLYPKFMIRLSLVIVPILLIGAFLFASSFGYARQRLHSDNSEQSALGRLPVFYASYRMFEAKPWFGWGYENFDQFDRQFQERVGDLVSPEKDHASHNLFLTVLAEQGITGIFFFLAPMFWWLILSLKALPKMPSEGYWSRKLLIIFWLIIIANIVVSNFTNMKIVFGLGLWWITLGLIANLVYPYVSTSGSLETKHVGRPSQI